MDKFIELLLEENGRASRSAYGWAIAGLIAFNGAIDRIMMIATRAKEAAQTAIVNELVAGKDLTHDVTGDDAATKELVGTVATSVATDSGLGFLLSLLLLALVFALMRTFYVLLKKRLNDIGWPVILAVIPCGLFIARQMLPAAAPDSVWWLINVAFMASFVALAFVPGEAETNSAGEPPFRLWPEAAPLTAPRAATPVRRAATTGRAKFGQRR